MASVPDLEVRLVLTNHDEFEQWLEEALVLGHRMREAYEAFSEHLAKGVRTRWEVETR